MGSFEVELDWYRPMITTSHVKLSIWCQYHPIWKHNLGFKEHNTEKDASGDLYLLHFQGRLLFQCSYDISDRKNSSLIFKIFIAWHCYKCLMSSLKRSLWKEYVYCSIYLCQNIFHLLIMVLALKIASVRL